MEGKEKKEGKKEEEEKKKKRRRGKKGEGEGEGEKGKMKGICKKIHWGKLASDYKPLAIITKRKGPTGPTAQKPAPLAVSKSAMTTTIGMAISSKEGTGREKTPFLCRVNHSATQGRDILTPTTLISMSNFGYHLSNSITSE